MQFWGYQRYHFTGQLWIMKDDPREEQPVLTYEKDITFGFSGDPSTPRQVVMCPEPIPSTSVITGVTDRYDKAPMPGAEWTITTVEPVIDLVGGTQMYRHQAALSKTSDFGYLIARSTD